MKIPTFIRRKKKLRASTARRSLGMPDEMDYEEMSEPNMKLSRALVIVLLLHIVAVAGIVAFNSIKTRPGSLPAMNAVGNTKAPAKEVASVDPPVVKAAAEPVAARRAEAKPAHASSQSVAKEERKTEHAKPAAKSSVVDSGKVYVVVKGDNPVTIARKFKVSYDDLLVLNHIADPRKLQIGQKLLIPEKAAKKKKPED